MKEMLNRPNCRHLLFALMIVLSPVSEVISKPLGGDFALTDHNGQEFSLAQLRGKVVLLFFGYTSCPDVCPKELADLAMVFSRLGDEADKVQGLFVTVDPERDTQQVLKEYVSYFSSNIIGLSGSAEEIDTVTRQYHTSYRLNKQQGKFYSVDHAANLYVIDLDGRLHTIVPYGFPAQHVLGIVNNLIKHSHN